MKVIYKKSWMEKIELEVRKAKRLDKKIDYIKFETWEFNELLHETGYCFYGGNTKCRTLSICVTPTMNVYAQPDGAEVNIDEWVVSVRNY